jgi:isoleucyl-tRNA synthetase
LDAVGIRKAARNLATKTVADQMKGFKDWGVMADWNKAWRTMDKSFEIKQLEVFQEMVKRDLIFRSYKPVYWSPSSKTALAEAELEYKDDHESTAAYIEFPIVSLPEKLQSKYPDIDISNISAIIWTTTPWTLPANRAIAFHKDLEYSVVRPTADSGQWVVAKSRLADIEQVLSKSHGLKSEFFGNPFFSGTNANTAASRKEPLISQTSGQRLEVVVESVLGSDLGGIQYVNILRGRNSSPQPFMHADFVSAESGSGLVHLAPGHGMDDYDVCMKRGIQVDAPVDDLGRFTIDALPDDPEALRGKAVLSAGTEEVLKILEKHQKVVAIHKHKHKYPYDWRTKLPVIVRATKQWFAEVGSVKNDALQSLREVRFIPESGRSRLESFVKSRSEWCISRQRAWGVPIPALYNENGDAVLTHASVAHIISVFAQRGIEAWWTNDPDDPAWIAPGLSGFHKRGKDTMDVWFDSGSSWTQTPQQADVYLEGTDQHRGWFQSSLLTHTCASERGGAPYKTLITHGFTLDQEGKKMSKSIGNIIAPSQIMDGSLHPSAISKGKHSFAGSNALGPDALRLWVANCDYTRDVAIGQEILKSNHATLLKYRVTLKMLLGSMHASARTAIITKVDEIALFQLQKVMADVAIAYANFDFCRGISLINKWMNGDLSAFYLETAKDRLYCGDGGGVIEEIFHGLLRMLTPILPRLVEEAWDHRPLWMKEEEQIHPFHQTLADPLTSRNFKIDKEISDNIPWLLKANAAIKTAQEEARAKKVIGSSLQSSVFLQLSERASHLFDRYRDDLENIFVVSSVEIGAQFLQEGDWVFSEDFDTPCGKGTAWVQPPKQDKCPRCWRYVAPAEDELCERCKQVVSGL